MMAINRVARLAGTAKSSLDGAQRNPGDGVASSRISLCFMVSVHSPLPIAGSATVLAAIPAGETPALPGGGERLRFMQATSAIHRETDFHTEWSNDSASAL